VKHSKAEPKTLLSHLWHLLNELETSFVVVVPGPAVTASFSRVDEAPVISEVDVLRDVSELSTLTEFKPLDSRGSTVAVFCVLLLAGPSAFVMAGRSYDGSGMLDEVVAVRRGEHRRAGSSSVELRISLGDGSGE
jgi:hypothetical protein